MFHFRVFIAFILLSLHSIILFAQKDKKNAWHYLSDTKTPEEILAIENKLQRLYYIMAGEFSNEHTLGLQTKVPHQDFITIPIWKDRKDEYWLHWGWYKHGEPERALAQGILNVSRLNRDSFQVIFYPLPKEEENNYYSLEWTKKNPFSNLKPKDLVEAEKHAYLIFEREDNIFELVHSDKPQHFNMSDAIKYINLNILFSLEKQINSTLFFDANQEVLFGFGDRNNGGIFERRDKNNPYYKQHNKKKKK